MQGFLKLDLLKKEIRSGYGSQNIILTYEVKHLINGFSNIYIVEAEIKYLNTFEPEIYFNTVINVENNNEETILSEVLIDTLNDCEPNQLLGREEL